MVLVPVSKMTNSLGWWSPASGYGTKLPQVIYADHLTEAYGTEKYRRIRQHVFTELSPVAEDATMSNPLNARVSSKQNHASMVRNYLSGIKTKSGERTITLQPKPEKLCSVSKSTLKN